MTRPIVLRGKIEVDDPLTVALGFVNAGYAYDMSTASMASTFGEADLRLANRGGARIAAAEIAAVLERRRRIERALRAIAHDASLAGTPDAVPWLPMGRLFDAFADIRGVGFAKMTKALHRKRPALIPMLDSVVQRYLAEDDVGPDAPFGERALGFVRGYKRDLDLNRAALRDVRRELARRSYDLTEVRLLDMLIWAASAG